MFGQVLALQDNSVEQALEVFDHARTMADSCDSELISLRSRASLWRLSRGGENILRRHHYRELVKASCLVKSPLSRNEAVHLCHELGHPILLNQLWSYDNSYLFNDRIQLECIVPVDNFRRPHFFIDAFTGSREQIRAPWEGMLAIFTATILTQVVNTICVFLSEAGKTETKLKIITLRDPEKEGFAVLLESVENRAAILREINKLFASDNDFDYYDALAKALGATLKCTTDEVESSIIKLEMPLIESKVE
jgi:hypothetical protein